MCAELRQLPGEPELGLMMPADTHRLGSVWGASGLVGSTCDEEESSNITPAFDEEQELLRAFPPHRVQGDRVRAWHIAIAALAVVLALVRLVLIATIALVFGLLPPWPGLVNLQIRLLGSWWVSGMCGKMQYRTRSGELVPWSEAAEHVARDGVGGGREVIFAPEHHAAGPESFAMSVGGACGPPGMRPTFLAHRKIKDSFVSRNTTPARANTVCIGRGAKLADAVAEWRRDFRGTALTVFPQGATAAADVVIAFQQRIFELEGHRCAILPVAVDIDAPLPLNLRTACGSFAGDILAVVCQPFVHTTITVRPPLDATLPPAEMARACKRAILEGGTTRKHDSNVTLFAKSRWTERAATGQYSTYRCWELSLQRRLQSLPGRAALLRFSLAIHWVLQEAAILLIGAVLFFAYVPWNVLVSVARACTLALLVNHLIKICAKLPRPAWARMPALVVNPYALGLHQYDYTFPSGHSSFVMCLWTSIAAANIVAGNGNPLYYHVIMAVLVAVTGFGRMYLSLHFAGDVAAGWLTGGVIGWFWSRHGETRWLTLSYAQQLAAAAAVVAAAGALWWACAHAGRAAEWKRIDAWRAMVGDPSLNPLKPHLWLLALGMYIGVTAVITQYTYVATQLGVFMRDAPQWLRAVYVAIGMVGLVVTGAACIWLPRRALRRATGGCGGDGGTRAAAADTLPTHVDATSGGHAPFSSAKVEAPVAVVEEPTPLTTPDVSDVNVTQTAGAGASKGSGGGGRAAARRAWVERADAALFFVGVLCVMEWIFCAAPLVFWRVNNAVAAAP